MVTHARAGTRGGSFQRRRFERGLAIAAEEPPGEGDCDGGREYEQQCSGPVRVEGVDVVQRKRHGCPLVRASRFVRCRDTQCGTSTEGSHDFHCWRGQLVAGTSMPGLTRSGIDAGAGCFVFGDGRALSLGFRARRRCRARRVKRCPVFAMSPALRCQQAEAQRWFGEVEGIDLTLTFLRDKRDATERHTACTKELGMPTIR